MNPKTNKEMKPKLLYLIKMLAVGITLMFLARISYGQDSTQVNQIGFVVYEESHQWVKCGDSIPQKPNEDGIFEFSDCGKWISSIKKDTIWFNENEPIALPGNYEKVLWRKKWLKRYY